MTTSVLIVPGYGGSGPQHWQSLWEVAHPDFRRVEQRDWEQPERDEWVRALDAAVLQAQRPVVLVAHSLGCLVVAHWAAQQQRAIHGALLVAPPDAEDPGFAVDARGFAPIPLTPLPFRSMVVGSTDDPYAEPERVAYFAAQWGSRFVSVGASGHINTAAGFGPWPIGEELLAELCMQDTQ